MTLFTKLSILCILILACTTSYLFKRNADLTQKNADQAVTISSLEQGVVTYKNKFGEVYTRSMNQVRTASEVVHSKDSTITELMRQLTRANIKLANVVQVGSTVTKLVYDTTLVYVPTNNDTTLNTSRPPYIYQTVALTKGRVKVSTDIRDTTTTISHLKREFVEPRKSFFLWRWFQKRQNVLYTDKHHSNPFITTLEQTDITILGKDGKPKTSR